MGRGEREMFAKPVGELETGIQLVGMQNSQAVVEDSRSITKEAKK